MNTSPLNTSQSAFPPIAAPEYRREVALASQLLSGIYPELSATYISTPINNGLLFMAWQTANPEEDPRTPENRADRWQNVATPNRAAALAIGQRLRRFGVEGPFIEPAHFAPIPEWGQGEYLEFWEVVIRRYCSRIIFCDGWEYSNGCAYEFLVGVRTHKELFTADYQLLTREQGRQMMSNAVLEMVERDQGSPEFIRQVLTALNNSHAPYYRAQEDV